ncbi:MAG TPA: group I intron-associated PD-(D/E)XK endonuclease [Ramlibacter sp.]|nr:group I intron-associated PD-(D/E)XK endonuclease [Ramlibacter sp.]
MSKKSGHAIEASRRAIEIGTAGEHIVCADLILAGYRASIAAQGLPYDVIADINGWVLRIAVKSTLRATKRPEREGARICYQFCATRTKRDSKGKTSARRYTPADADIVAFVGLDKRCVAYVALTADARLTSWHVQPPGEQRAELDRLGRRNGQNKKHFEDFPLAAALAALGSRP